MEKDMDKIAIIDLGSNSTRLVLVDILKGGYFQVVDDIKETVRLAQDMEIDDRLVDTYIKNLRKKLHLDCIKTVKGIGYKLEVIQ